MYNIYLVAVLIHNITASEIVPELNIPPMNMVSLYMRALLLSKLVAAQYYSPWRKE